MLEYKINGTACLVNIVGEKGKSAYYLRLNLEIINGRLPYNPPPSKCVRIPLREKDYTDLLAKIKQLRTELQVEGNIYIRLGVEQEAIATHQESVASGNCLDSLQVP